jgi:peroxiredoxin
MSSSRDDYSKFTAADTEVVGISMNHTLSQKAFSDFLKLNFPLGSDFPEGKTASAYGVYNADRRLAQRSYFIVDKQGVIRYKKVLGPKDPLVENDALLAEVKTLK